MIIEDINTFDYFIEVNFIPLKKMENKIDNKDLILRETNEEFIESIYSGNLKLLSNCLDKNKGVSTKLIFEMYKNATPGTKQYQILMFLWAYSLVSIDNIDFVNATNVTSIWLKFDMFGTDMTRAQMANEKLKISIDERVKECNEKVELFYPMLQDTQIQYSILKLCDYYAFDFKNLRHALPMIKSINRFYVQYFVDTINEIVVLFMLLSRDICFIYNIPIKLKFPKNMVHYYSRKSNPIDVHVQKYLKLHPECSIDYDIKIGRYVCIPSNDYMNIIRNTSHLKRLCDSIISAYNIDQLVPLVRFLDKDNQNGVKDNLTLLVCIIISHFLMKSSLSNYII